MATVTPMALGTTAGTPGLLLHRLRPMAMATHTAAPTAATATATATPIPPTMAAATAMATPMAGATTTRCSSLFVRHEAQLADRSVGSPRAQLARQWSIV